MNYQIVRTAPTVYLDETGNAINGYKVTIYFPEFDETHFLNVASLDPSVVSAAAEKLYGQRKALSELSNPPKK
jgi:hypothetical protein